MDNLTAVMAALYSSSVAMTHSHQVLAGARYMVLVAYFSERFRSRQKDRMFSASVMDA